VDDTGNIQEGKRADLLTSPTSPLETAWSAGRMSAVIAGGHLMLASDLDAAIERQQAWFRGAFARLTSRWLTQFAVARLARHFVP